MRSENRDIKGREKPFLFSAPFFQLMFNIFFFLLNVLAAIGRAKVVNENKLLNKCAGEI